MNTETYFKCIVHTFKIRFSELHKYENPTINYYFDLKIKGDYLNFEILNLQFSKYQTLHLSNFYSYGISSRR